VPRPALNDGASAFAAQLINPISLSARAYRRSGQQKVDLAWHAAGTSYDVYRDGGKIATTPDTAYTDNINRRGSGTYAYKVCAAGGWLCSNTASVSF
jgi:hypothetical protein